MDDLPEPMNLTSFIPLPVTEVEFSRRRVRLMCPYITQFKDDLTDKDLSIYAAWWALEVFEKQNKVQGLMKFGSCEKCEDYIGRIAREYVNMTFYCKGIQCHKQQDVEKLAVYLASEAVLSSGYFD